MAPQYCLVWKALSKVLGRNPQAIRLPWLRRLHPDVQRQGLWTAEEDALLLQRSHEGVRQRDVAVELRRSEMDIADRLHRHVRSDLRWGRWSPAEDTKLLKMLEGKVPRKERCQALPGRTLQAINWRTWVLRNEEQHKPRNWTAEEKEKLLNASRAA